MSDTFMKEKQRQQSVYQTEPVMQTMQSYDSKYREFNGPDALATAEKEKLEYNQKKMSITSMWAQKASGSADAPTPQAQTSKVTQKEFFGTYNLNQLATLLKSNDMGGGSDAYNDVVKQLDRYNAGQSDDAALQESVNAYLSTRRSAWTKNAKIRKAIVMQVRDRFS